MREKDYVVIIGSANIDVAGYSHESLNYADSNPGKIKFTPGGVGRNIAQNLALLGNKAWLLSAVGSDFYGQSHSTVNLFRGQRSLLRTVISVKRHWHGFWIMPPTYPYLSIRFPHGNVSKCATV